MAGIDAGVRSQDSFPSFNSCCDVEMAGVVAEVDKKSAMCHMRRQGSSQGLESGYTGHPWPSKSQPPAGQV